jgi:hypothetical protein
MKFLHHLFSRNEPGFDNISGYDDIKDIVIRALDADENYNLLFIGPLASSKTLFLMGIQEIRKDAVYFDCSNTTSRILEEVDLVTENCLADTRNTTIHRIIISGIRIDNPK